MFIVLELARHHVDSLERKTYGKQSWYDVFCLNQANLISILLGGVAQIPFFVFPLFKNYIFSYV